MVIILHLMQRKCLIFTITILFQYQKSKKMYERDLMKSTKFLFLLLYSFLFIYAFLCAMHTVLTCALYFSSLYLILFYYVFWNSFIFPFFSEKLIKYFLKVHNCWWNLLTEKVLLRLRMRNLLCFDSLGWDVGRALALKLESNGKEKKYEV